MRTHIDGTCMCAERPCLGGHVGADGGHCDCGTMTARAYRAQTPRTPAEMGRKGGSVRGASKVRGDSAHYRALVAKRYVARGEWGGYEIRAGRIGWIVERDSRHQDDTTDERVRIGYYLVPATVDLDATINEMGTTYAQLIIEYAQHGKGQLLRRGRRVE